MAINVNSLKVSIAKALCPEVFIERNELQTRVESLLESTPVKFITEEKIVYKDKLVEVEKQSAIDKYFETRYKLIPNIAYQNKRNSTLSKSKDVKKSYSVYLNQMITPSSYEVVKFRKPFDKIKDLYSFAQESGDLLAKTTRWTDEQMIYNSGDYYLYPEETLTTMSQQCDCEDVSFVMASLKPDSFAVAYGFWYMNGRDKPKFGHAFPVFVYEDKLYIVETTGDSVEITSANSNLYEIVYLITKDNTYRVLPGIEFGKLAEF